jgi:hypothetical protein
MLLIVFVPAPRGSFRVFVSLAATMRKLEVRCGGRIPVEGTVQVKREDFSWRGPSPRSMRRSPAVHVALDMDQVHREREWRAHLSCG